MEELDINIEDLNIKELRTLRDLTSNLGYNLEYDAVVFIQPSGEIFLDELNLETVGSQSIEVSVLKHDNNDSFTMRKPKATNVEALIKQVVVECISRKHLLLNSNILAIANKIKPYNLVMLHFTVDKVLYRIGRFKLAEALESEEVLESVLQIAQEIGVEGREGKAIGTWFVIGDYELLQPFVKQLVLNPFHGYPKEVINIKNPELRETIKEFSQLDGAFVIHKDGTIMSAGAYIEVDTSNVKPFYGWGSKHLAAAAITKKVNCLAVVVSQSGGAVKVFKNGKLFLKIT